MEGKPKHGWDIFNSPSAAASGPSSPTKEFCHCQGPDQRGRQVDFIGAERGLGCPLGSATSCLMVIEGATEGRFCSPPLGLVHEGPEGYPTAHRTHSLRSGPIFNIVVRISFGPLCTSILYKFR